jgi:hypothetical protein
LQAAARLCTDETVNPHFLEISAWTSGYSLSDLPIHSAAAPETEQKEKN